MSGAVLVFVEHAGGEPDRLSLEALALARGIASGLGVTVDAVLLGTGADAAAARLGPHGVGLAHVAADAKFDDYAPAAWGAAIRDVVTTGVPAAVVAAGSERGNEVLAHVAARAGVPMAANVVEVEPVAVPPGAGGSSGSAGRAASSRTPRSLPRSGCSPSRRTPSPSILRRPVPRRRPSAPSTPRSSRRT